jgi:hypothetical protein
MCANNQQHDENLAVLSVEDDAKFVPVQHFLVIGCTNAHGHAPYFPRKCLPCSRVGNTNRAAAVQHLAGSASTPSTGTALFIEPLFDQTRALESSTQRMGARASAAGSSCCFDGYVNA